MLRLIFSRKSTFTDKIGLRQLIYFNHADFSKRIKGNTKRRFVQHEEEQEEKFSKDDENDEKPSINEENETEADRRENSVKEKMANFFSFSKNKATYTFADTGKESPNKDEEEEDDETESMSPEEMKAFNYSEEEDNEVSKSNEFMKMYKKEVIVAEVKIIEKIETLVIKTAYEQLKDFLQIENNHNIVKETYINKNFEKEIKPYIEILNSEFNLNTICLQRIYRI